MSVEEKPKLESEIVEMFVDKCLDKFKTLLKVEELRVYSYEFPVEYEGEKGRVDLILEVVRNKNVYDRENPLLIIEFKRSHIKYGPIDQLQFYMKSVGPKLYRPHTHGFLAAPSYSSHEIQEAKKNKFHCIQFDLSGNIKLV